MISLFYFIYYFTIGTGRSARIRQRCLRASLLAQGHDTCDLSQHGAHGTGSGSGPPETHEHWPAFDAGYIHWSGIQISAGPIRAHGFGLQLTERTGGAYTCLDLPLHCPPTCTEERLALS